MCDHLTPSETRGVFGCPAMTLKCSPASRVQLGREEAGGRPPLLAAPDTTISSQQSVPIQRSAAALRPRLTAWPTLAC